MSRMATEALDKIDDLERVIARYREAIDAVLADAESQEGGWGPDVTMVAVLETARTEDNVQLHDDEQAAYDAVTVTGSGRDVTKEES